MKTVCIYHASDFDGIFCREIARKFLPDATLIGWDYGEPTPAKELIDGKELLYMMDISVNDLMDHPNLIWIDHHKTAIDKFPSTIPGYRIDGVAACRLAWQWFQWQAKGLDPHFNQLDPALPTKEEYVNRTVAEPWAVRLAGEYDIWDKRDPDAELFQHGLRSEELYTPAWVNMLDSECGGSSTVVRLLDQGRALQYAKTHENAGIITTYGYDVEFHGIKFLACNHARFNSLLFTAGLKAHHQACLGYVHDGEKFKVSLYHAPGHEHLDLSIIAKEYGGGGHKGACGFVTHILPFGKV